MALTVEQLAAAIRVGTSDAEIAEVTRIKEYGEAEIIRFAARAPSTAKDEALIRIVGYLYDAPTTAYANAFQNSGAAAMLLPYRVHRAGIVSGATATEVTPGGGGSQSGASQSDINRLDAEVADLKADVAALDVEIDDNADAAAADAAAAQTTANDAKTAADSAVTIARSAATDAGTANVNAAAATTAANEAKREAKNAQDRVDQRGVDAGGDMGQILAKKSNVDYDTEWIDNTGGDNSIISDKVAHLDALTRDLSITEGQKTWVQGQSGANIGIAVLSGTIDAAALQNASYVAEINIPENGWGNATRYIIARVNANLNPALNQLRIEVGAGNLGSLHYMGNTAFNEIEVNDANWDYYYVQLKHGVNGGVLGLGLTYILAQYHTASEVTEYAGNVTGTIDDKPVTALVPAAGTTGQVLAKKSDDDYDTEWIAAAAGGGGGKGFRLVQLNQSQPTLVNSGSVQRTYLEFNSTDANLIRAAMLSDDGLYFHFFVGRNADNTVRRSNYPAVPPVMLLEGLTQPTRDGGTEIVSVFLQCSAPGGAYLTVDNGWIQIRIRSSECRLRARVSGGSGDGSFQTTANCNVYAVIFK